jgi:hypothetical protein
MHAIHVLTGDAVLVEGVVIYLACQAAWFNFHRNDREMLGDNSRSGEAWILNPDESGIVRRRAPHEQ